jgi:pimeloyl-ACP methyl ester carboxylesterase
VGVVATLKKEGVPMKRREFLTSASMAALAVTAPFSKAVAAEEAHVYEKAVTQFVDVNGAKIAYRSFGHGEPLIMLQRFRGSMDDWDPGFLNPIGKSRRVITFDSAGVAESKGTVPPNLEGAADVAVSFAQAIGIQRADFAGWSMGGMTGQILAVKYPEAVRKLVLIGTLPPGGSPDVVPSPQDWGSVAGKPAYTQDDLLYLFFSPSPAGREAGLKSLQRTSFRRPATEQKSTTETMQAHYGAIVGFYKNDGGWYEKLKSISAPTLVVNGDKDLAFPAIDSVILGREIPKAQVALYPDSGHGSHFQYPDRAAQDILVFLKG